MRWFITLGGLAAVLALPMPLSSQGSRGGQRRGVPARRGQPRHAQLQPARDNASDDGRAAADAALRLQPVSARHDFAAHDRPPYRPSAAPR